MKERKLGLLGKKLGMTRIFDTAGNSVGVTVLALGPCLVVGKRTQDKDGYTALVLGFDDKPERKVNKAEAGVMKAAGGVEKAKRYIRELRVSNETLAKFEVGQLVTLGDLDLKAGDMVDVAGQSKGKGFQGVMKRYHFKGFRATHGTHEYFRHGGSIGCRKWPGRVFKGRKMPGHMGDRAVTTQNIRIAQVRTDENVLVLHGSVPGAKNGYLVVRAAIKYHPEA